ncbi:MAG TPA: LptF/LptG family permease, partial [Deinococcales bacterium]|nr:LptF/LptG family permease [Deinococcales bacterium]
MDRYLLRESVPAVLFGMLLYSVLGVVSATLPRLQWIVGAPVGEVLGWLLLQLPTSLVQTLPLALVLAVLVSYGRLAADRELIALQAGSVPLWRVSLLYTGLGLACTVLSLGINEYVLPATHARVATQYWQLTSGSSGLFRLAQQALALDEFTLHFDGVDRDTDEMQGVRIERWQEKRLLVLFADRAVFEERGLRLSGHSSAELDLGSLTAEHADAGAAYAALVRADSRPRDPDSTLLLTTSETQADLIARYDEGGFEDPISLSGARRQAANADLNHGERRRMLVLFHRKL